jgi:predicted Zn-dependent protease
MQQIPLLALVFSTALSSACASTTSRKVETAVASAMVSTDQENQIGLQLKNELDQKEHVVYVTDPVIVDYVRKVAGKVISLGKKDRPDVAWQVNVIDDPKTVNAFATPGGYLYVYRGLLETADNEAQLAGVMAHETGHVVARHAARGIVAQYGLQAVAAIATGSNPGLVAQLGSTIAGKGLMLAHSRADETEADEYGARYASGAGYDPHALITFFQRLQQSEGHTPKLLAYLSDHPATADRIQHLESYIAAHDLQGSNLGTESYAALRQRLSQVPSPPASPAAGAPATASTPPGAAAPKNGAGPKGPPPPGAPPPVLK